MAKREACLRSKADKSFQQWLFAVLKSKLALLAPT